MYGSRTGRRPQGGRLVAGCGHRRECRVRAARPSVLVAHRNTALTDSWSLSCPQVVRCERLQHRAAREPASRRDPQAGRAAVAAQARLVLMAPASASGNPQAVAEAFVAAGLDDADRLDSLFHYGAVDAQATDADGNTLLHEAAAQGNLRAAKSIVKRAVFWHTPARRDYLNLRNAAGFTALDLARASGSDGVASWLLALGAADPLAPPPRQRGPPHMAVSRAATAVPQQRRSMSPPSRSRPGTSVSMLNATAPASFGGSNMQRASSPPFPSMPRRGNSAFALLESYILSSLSGVAPPPDSASVRSALVDVASALTAGQTLQRERQELLAQLDAAKQLATRAAASARGAVATDRQAEIDTLKAQLASAQATAQTSQTEAADLRRELERVKRDCANALADAKVTHADEMAALESQMMDTLDDLQASFIAKGYDCGYADGADAERSRAAAAPDVNEMLPLALASVATPSRSAADARASVGHESASEVDDVLRGLISDADERRDSTDSLVSSSHARASARVRTSSSGMQEEEPLEVVHLRPVAPLGNQPQDSDDEELELALLRTRLKAAAQTAADGEALEEDQLAAMLASKRDSLRPISPEPSPNLRRLETALF